MTHIEINRKDGIVICRMNRPEKKNAITGAMYDAMTAALDAAQHDGTRAFVFLGSPGAFCAGNDIMDFLQYDPGSEKTPAFTFIRMLAKSAIPMVAGVDGLAIGIGATMLLHCDLVYATARTSCRLPFLDLGLVPEAASTLLLPRLVGLQRASAALLLGEPISAEEARQMGLVNAILPEADVEQAATEAAGKLAKKPPQALAATRRLIRGDQLDLLERINEEGEAFRERLQSDEAKAAFMAFMAKGK